MDKLDFLDTDEPTATETAEPAQHEPSPAPDPAEPTEAKPERLRGPDGKFARARDDEIMVPLKALHETRDEVRDLKARLAQFDQPQPDFAPHIPDMFEDPDGYTEWQNQQMSRAIYAERYNTSLRFAEQQHGHEAVQQAVDWAAQRAAQDPQFNLAALSQPDPVAFALQQYQRERIVAEVDPGTYEKFKAWQAATAGAANQQPARPGHYSPSSPPHSIASLPSSGGATHVPAGPGQAFDLTFRN